MGLDYLEIGRNIRHYRQLLGIRQKELAEYIHVSDQHISHIENWHTKLSLVTLVAIANTLKVDCNTLLGHTLYNVKDSVLHQRLNEIVSEMDTTKLGLVVEFCDMLDRKSVV